MISCRAGVGVLRCLDRVEWSGGSVMARSWWFGAAVLAAVLGAGAPVAAAAPQPATHGPVYYLDCGAPGSGDGSQSNPWTSLAQVDATVFAPGSSLLVS